MQSSSRSLDSGFGRLVSDESVSFAVGTLVERDPAPLHLADCRLGAGRVAHVARVVLVVVLLQVSRKMFLGRAVVGALDLPLQVGGESLGTVGRNDPARIWLNVGVVLLLVVDALVRLEELADLQVGRILVGHQPGLLGNGVLAEVGPQRSAVYPVGLRIQGDGLRLADNRGAVFPLAVPLHDGLHGDLVAAITLAHMLPTAPDVRLVALDDARELLRVVLHRLADAVSKVPRALERDP